MRFPPEYAKYSYSVGVLTVLKFLIILFAVKEIVEYLPYLLDKVLYFLHIVIMAAHRIYSLILLN